jgi:protein TonB
MLAGQHLLPFATASLVLHALILSIDGPSVVGPAPAGSTVLAVRVTAAAVPAAPMRPPAPAAPEVLQAMPDLPEPRQAVRAPVADEPPAPVHVASPIETLVKTLPMPTAPAVPGAGSLAEPEQATDVARVVEKRDATAASGFDSPLVAAVDHDAVEAVIHRDLARFFEYPRLARRRGWEGEVRLSFRVSVSGAITAIRVSRSSGYPILDRAAVAALQQIPHIRPAPRAPAELELPITYRLTES